MKWLATALLKVVLAVLGKGWLWGRKPRTFSPDEEGILPSSYAQTSGWIFRDREVINDVVWIMVWTPQGNWHRTQVQVTASGREHAIVKVGPNEILDVYLP